MKNRVSIIAIFLILVLIITACSTVNNNFNTTEEQAIKTNTTEAILDQNEVIKAIQEDFVFFKSKYLELHPGLRNTKLRNQFLQRYDQLYALINQKTTDEDVFFLLSQLTTILSDGHAIIEPLDEKQFLPFTFKWNKSGLYIAKSNVDNVAIGDKVVSISNLDTNSLLASLRKIISTENDYWLRERATRLIRMQYVLSYLSISDDNSVQIELIKPDGRKIIEQVKLESGLKAFMGSRPSRETSYKILENNNVVILIIPACINNSTYKETLKTFFNHVANQEISRVVIDLRENKGGDSTVIKEFLKYIDVDKVDYFYRVGVNNERSITLDHHNRVLYDGDIFVATSNKTFSSAALFAGVIKYNKLGLTIGEPTGNATIRYGFVERYELPNSKIKFSVSTTKWALPNVSYNSTIPPDIPIQFDVDDLINNIDPIESWFKTN